MKQLLQQLSLLFSGRERIQLASLVVLLIVRAVAEMVGVGAVGPFMSMVADPTIITRNAFSRELYEYFGFASASSFLTAAGVTVMVLLALSNSMSAFTLWIMLRFAWAAHDRLSNRLLAGYLALPYSFFLDHNSARLSKRILTETQAVIEGVLIPTLNILARSVVVLALIGLLTYLNPRLAFFVVLVLGGAYGGLYMLVKRRQRRLGRERVAANELRYKVTGEAFGGIKDLKVLDRASVFGRRFAPPSAIYSRAAASNGALMQLPRYLFETIAFGGLVAIVLFYLHAGAAISDILPLMSVYAFAGYRLMPELQQLFGSIAAVRFNEAALGELVGDFARFQAASADAALAPLPFEHAIEFRNVEFAYPNARGSALVDANLVVPRHGMVGFVGRSGSGKTTAADLLLGLYEPTAGEIRVDNVRLSGGEVLMRWRKRVGYVAQSVFLSDDTITANIAFGIPPDEVDHNRVQEAARIANIDSFIDTLPARFNSIVGERGVRLSGGQRQRIGIARALYADPDVIVLDEATSSLDGKTEGAVMEAIANIARSKTIIMIAHRVSTLRECDCIYLFDAGRIIESGTYEQLSLTSGAFRDLGKLPEPEALGDARLSSPA